MLITMLKRVGYPIRRHATKAAGGFTKELDTCSGFSYITELVVGFRCCMQDIIYFRLQPAAVDRGVGRVVAFLLLPHSHSYHVKLTAAPVTWFNVSGAVNFT